MDDYPGNSRRRMPNDDKVGPIRNKKEAEAKKIERIVSGEVVRRKKPLSKRFREVFVGEDSRGVWTYVVLDVLVPAAKDMVADAVSTGIERTLFGEVRSGARRGGRGRSSNGFVDYSARSNPYRRDESRREISRRGRTTHDFDEVILETRGTAEQVIDQLFELVDRFDSATVADLYDLVGISGSFTDQKWGWTDLRGAGVSRVRDGYLLDLPRPSPID